MVCDTCGKDNPTNTKSCWNCGEALAGELPSTSNPARLNSSPGKVVTLYGYLYIVASAILLTVALLEKNSGGTRNATVTLTAFFQAGLFGVTGWSILTGHRWALTLVWVATVLGAIGVLFRGLIPLDLLLWLTSLGLAVWYTRKWRLLVLANKADAEIANSVSIQLKAEPELPTQSMDSAPSRGPAHGRLPVPSGAITRNPEIGQGSDPGLAAFEKATSSAPGNGAAAGKRIGTLLRESIILGAVALIAAGVLLFSPALKAIHQMYARKELAELKYKYDTFSFFRAIARWNTLAVRLFLRAGMSPNTIDPSEGTPLAEAAFSGHVETVKLLLDNGANPNSEDKYFGTPLAAAAASNWDNMATIRLLLQRGAQLDVRVERVPIYSHCSGSILMVAAGGDHTNINNLNYLLEKGASTIDPYHLPNDPGDALDCAVLVDNRNAMKLFIQHGAWVTLQDVFSAKTHDAAIFLLGVMKRQVYRAYNAKQ